MKETITCTTETSEIAEPVSDGGCDSLELGSDEYAEGEAERTFKAYKPNHMPQNGEKINIHKAKKTFEEPKLRNFKTES